MNVEVYLGKARTAAAASQAAASAFQRSHRSYEQAQRLLTDANGLVQKAQDWQRQSVAQPSQQEVDLAAATWRMIARGWGRLNLSGLSVVSPLTDRQMDLLTEAVHRCDEVAVVLRHP